MLGCTLGKEEIKETFGIALFRMQWVDKKPFLDVGKCHRGSTVTQAGKTQLLVLWGGRWQRFLASPGNSFTLFQRWGV